MGLRPTETDEDVDNGVGRTPWSAAGPLAGLRLEADEGVGVPFGPGPGGPPHLGECVFRGVPYGPRRATKGNEDASVRPRRISNLNRIFRGAEASPGPWEAEK